LNSRVEYIYYILSEGRVTKCHLLTPMDLLQILIAILFIFQGMLAGLKAKTAERLGRKLLIGTAIL